MLTQLFSLYTYTILELILAFATGFGALLIWHLHRYRFLALFFIFQSVLMLLNISEPYYRQLTGIFLITPIFTLAKGALLYLFIRKMVNETPLHGWKLYRHFVPMLLALPLTVDPQFVIMLGSISQLVYLACSFKLLHRYHRMARSFRADADELELTWVVHVFSLFTAQVLVSLIRLNLQLQLSPVIRSIWFSFDITFLLVLCCFMLYKALKQPHLYDDMLAYEEENKLISEKKRERNKDEIMTIFSDLETIILNKNMHKQARLTVGDIAKETGLQMKDISWSINVGSGQNFNEYINRLRVDEIKQQLCSGQESKTSLLDLAFNAGFNSKSTFNTVFKRETGMTPSQFIKNNLAQK